MADVELPDLPAVVTIADSDLLHIRQGIEDKKSTVATLEVHLDTKYLRQDDNLASLDNDATARANLGVLSESEGDAKYLEELNNLSDLTNVTVARNNLGLGSLATQNEGTGGADFRDNDANDARFLLEANNLSDLTNAVTARTNLGLGSAAVVNTGTGAGNVPTTSQADARYLLESNNLSDVTSPATAYDNIKQPATTSSLGAVEKATPTEMSSGGTDKFPDCPTIRSYVGQELGGLEYAKFSLIGANLVSSGRIGTLVSGTDSVGSVRFFNGGYDAFIFGETISSGEKHIWHMNLTDRYNLANATQSAKINLGTSSSLDGAQLHIQPDGSRVFLAARQFMYSYTLSTPFDLTTLTSEHLESINMFDCNGAQFAPDGSYFVGGGEPTSGFAGITYTPLTTNWDISTQGTHVDTDLESTDNITVINAISILKDKKDTRDHVAFTGIFNNGSGNVGKYYEYSFSNGFGSTSNNDLVDAPRDIIPAASNGIRDIDNELGVYTNLSGVLYSIYTFAKPIMI